MLDGIHYPSIEGGYILNCSTLLKNNLCIQITFSYEFLSQYDIIGDYKINKYILMKDPQL